MRILHLIATLKMGGAERQLSILSRAQVLRGHDVHIGFAEWGALVADVSLAGVQITAVRRGSTRDPRIFHSVYRAISKIAPDVVQTWLVQMDVAGGAICVAKRIPWVMTERASDLAYRMSSPTHVARRALGRWSGAVVANSDEGRRMWVDLRGADSTHVIQNALEVEAIAAAPKATATSIGFSGPFALAVGRLTEQKNIDLLLEVADVVCEESNLNFVLCGAGPQEGFVRETIRDKKRTGRIFLFGSRDDVWSLMKAADVFVSTSRYEGHPNAVLEAMACRCPLVVSDISTHRSFLDPSTAEIVPSTDARAFVESILKVVTKRTESGIRAEAAFKVASCFTPELAAARYDNVYESILLRRSECAA